jgi:hypothetical protein
LGDGLPGFLDELHASKAAAVRTAAEFSKATMQLMASGGLAFDLRSSRQLEHG